jgi:hypothetical protein
MFFGGTARIVEHLDADVLDDLLSERLRQLRNLDRLVDIAQQIGSEQAVALPLDRESNESRAQASTRCKSGGRRRSVAKARSSSALAATLPAR